MSKRTRSIRGRRAAALVLACLASAVFVGHIHATGFHDEVAPGSDIMMKDLRWPYFAKGTYFCIWYTNFHPNKYTNLYGGVATGGDTKPPGMFMTYWNELTNVHEGPYFYRHGRGAEGAKGGANGKALFMKAGNWYRFVKRVFKAEERTDKSTFVGWWVKDVTNNVWYTHSIVQIPSDEKGFNGNGGFVEALAPKHFPRMFDRRLGYYRLDGKWHASHIRSSHPARFRLIEKDTIVRFETPQKNDPGAQKAEVEFPTKQPATPPLDKPKIEGAKVQVLGNQVVVTWSCPKGASPQLSYQIEVFADGRGKGAPTLVHMETAPHVFAKRLDVDRAPKSVRLTLTGIFDQKTTVLLPVKSAKPQAGQRVAVKTHPGLRYRFYEAPKGAKWQALPDFGKLEPSRLGYVKKLDDSVNQGRQNLYGMQYDGWLNAPKTGLYVLELGTCDGSRMSIDGKLVADNDGIHGTSVTHYPLALEKGLHSFALSYFKGGRKYLPRKIQFAWEGPGFPRRQVEMTDLACESAADLPEVRISLTGGMPKDGLLTDNAIEVRADIKAAGNQIEKVEFFCGAQMLGVLRPEGNQAVKLSALLPAGRNQVTARLWYNKNYSVNANELWLTAKNQAEAPWLVHSFDEKTFPIGVRHRDGELRFRGEGFSYVYQKTQGDFTLTARVADVAMATKENGVAGQNWVGLFVKRIHSNKTVTLQNAKGPYGGEDYGLFLTAGRGIRGTSDFPDFGGGRVSVISYGNKNHRWLRIVRRGLRHESYTSEDGKTWSKVAERISERFKGGRYAGICFRAVPGKSRTMFHGAFDKITLEAGAPPEPRSKPDPKDLSVEPRITALVQSAANPRTLFARSSNGLLKSTDRGESWTTVDAGATGVDARSVRSVAVHPKDDSILLRAGGRVSRGALKSGLWRSTNGGRSWTLVTREIDFDGAGPTAGFGEVVRFNPLDPKVAIAAGETKGVFVSRDAGKTWKYAGLKGERVTCLDFSPSLQYGRDTIFVAGTFADAEFAALGLGKPASPLKMPGRIYWVRLGDKLKAGKSLEVPELGVTNLQFGMHQNFVTVATTRGVYYTWMHGIAFAQRRHTMPADTMYVALGGRRFSDWTKFFFAAPFSGDDSSPVYYAEKRSRQFKPAGTRVQLKSAGAGVGLGDGVTCVLPDATETKTVFLCNRHGIFKSTDAGRSYRLVRPSATR